MLWPCQSTPAAKIYINGKLSVKGPDGNIVAMQECFSEDGYAKWISNLEALLHLVQHCKIDHDTL